MCQAPNDEAGKRDSVGEKNPSHLAVIATYRPRQVEERHHTDKSTDKGHGLVRALERSVDHKSAKQTKKYGSMAHKYFEVWLIERNPVENC